jgi:regulator of replication initiation timing
MSNIYDTTTFLLHKIENLKKQLKDEQEKNNKLILYIKSLEPQFEKPKLIRSTNETNFKIESDTFINI